MGFAEDDDVIEAFPARARNHLKLLCEASV